MTTLSDYSRKVIMKSGYLKLFSAFAGGYFKIYNGPVPKSAYLMSRKKPLVIFKIKNVSPEKGRGRFLVNFLSPQAQVKKTGTARWFQITKKDRRTVIFNGSIGNYRGEGDLNFSSTCLRKGSTLSIDIFNLSFCGEG